MMELAALPAEPLPQTSLRSSFGGAGQGSEHLASPSRSRNTSTCTTPTTAVLALDSICATHPLAAGGHGLAGTLIATPSSLPALPYLQPPTALLTRSALLASASIKAVSAELASGSKTADAQDLRPRIWDESKFGSPAEPTFPDRITLVVDYSGPQAHFTLAILLSLLLCLLGLTYRFRGTSWASQSWFMRYTGATLPAMALFSFTSLLLVTGLYLGAVTGRSDQSNVLRASEKLSKNAGHASPTFTLPASADFGLNVLPNVNDPEAIDPQTVCPGYRASNVHKTESGFTVDLDLAGPPCNVYGNDIEHLALFVESQAEDRVHVEIRPRYLSPRNETWFLLPEVLVPRPSHEPHYRHSNSALVVSWSNKPTFAFSVKRKATGDILFSTEGKVLVYEDQFIEFVSSLPENYNLYGLGEVIHGFRLGNNLTRTLFAADVADKIDANIYGNHPIYLDTRYFTAGDSPELVYAPNVTEKAAKYVSYTHGVFLRNAHAQEILLKPSTITWRTLGGSIDLYFYSGPKAEDVTKSYQRTTVGLPALQQYWTLGFHQCRWGYESWSGLQDVVDNFAKFEIPLETIWADIDYMRQYRDFENDPVRFGYREGAEFLAKLHANNQHFVPIVDSAIYAPNPENQDDAYPPYDRGVKAKAFVLNPDGSIYYGAVWPGYTVFPDWVGAALNGSGAIDWWIDEVSIWSKKVAFDGLWIDMSEVASFCVGSCGTGNLTLNPAHPPFELPGEPGNFVLQYPEGFELTNSSEAVSASSALHAQTASSSATASSTSYHRTKPTPGSRNVNWPPYVINHFHGDLAVHAISPNATHHGGYLEYDFHNLFGHQILNATYQALLKVFEGKRPFIIGRSTFAGSGKWAGHWGGDNEALWAFMYFSIPQALSFSIFGIPMFGVDTCGFGGNSNHEICSRWMQLSAFFPFYRNHNILGANSQEPYVWKSVAEATKAAMRIRYLLLPYMYTLMTQASLDGSTVMRALAWEFPNEPWLADADRQFLLGGAVMVIPCLEQGASTVNGVFPGVGDGTIWYDWYTLKAVKGVSQGQNVTIDAPLGHIPVYLRGGSVVPLQEPGMTTAESRRNPWGLIVALDKDAFAEGSLYLDDGESLEPAAVMWVHFSATSNSLSASPEGDYVDTNAFGNATVMGLVKSPARVKLNGHILDSRCWSYSEDRAVLSLHGLHHLFPRGAWTSAWEISWE